MDDNQNRRQTKWKTTKIEDDQNVSIEKVRVTDKNGPQIWTRVKILIKRRYLDNGAILQSLGTILRVAAIRHMKNPVLRTFLFIFAI